MLALEAKNPLLSDIKSAIENIIFTGNQANGSVISTNIISITDKLRHEILKILISYSDKKEITVDRDKITKGTINISFPEKEIKLSKQNIKIGVYDNNGKLIDTFDTFDRFNL